MVLDTLRIPRPRLISIQRERPEGFSVGDAALVKVAPGLLRFLNLRSNNISRIGDAFSPEWLLGIGGACTAAACAGQEMWGWTGISLSVDWSRSATEDEYLSARSVVEQIFPARFGKVSLVHSYEVVSDQTNEVLAHGKLVLASSHPEALSGVASSVVSSTGAASTSIEVESPISEAEDEGESTQQLNESEVQLKAAVNAGTDDSGPIRSTVLPPLVQFQEAPEHEKEDLFRLAQPSLIRSAVDRLGALTAGDSWEWLFPVDLFRILINPVGGGTEPLARRIHPFGLISLGAALYAALQLSASWKPLHADVRWIRPVRGSSDFRLICRLKSVEGAHLTLESLFYEAETQVAQVKLDIKHEGIA